MLRASFLYLSHRRGLQRFVTRQRLTAALAYRFVAGDRLDDAARVVADINRRGLSASLDHLGENVSEEQAARTATEDYLAAFERIAGERLNANVSVKLTQLGLDISADLCRELLTRILQRAQQLDNFVRIDMEGSAYTQRTLDLGLDLHQRYPNCGVVLQSYLYRTLDDVARVNAANVRVRLVKGAYDEPPAVAFPKKADVDANFASAMEQLLRKGTYPAIATHDERLIEAEFREAALDAAVAAARIDLTDLSPDRFDMVIVDEFHHAAATSYERVLDHLGPVELLGLTATPERSDGLPILHWFDERIAAELRLWDAIDQQYLAPFMYFGIHDGLDLRQIPWRRGRGYDEQALTAAYTSSDAWARLVVQQVAQHGSLLFDRLQRLLVRHRDRWRSVILRRG